MKSSIKIRNVFLIAILGFALGFIMMIIVDSETMEDAWQKMPSPPEEAVAILGLSADHALVVQTTNGNLYKCEIGQNPCTLSEFSDDEVTNLMEVSSKNCLHAAGQESLTGIPFKADDVVDACSLPYYSEVYTDFVLDKGNHLWHYTSLMQIDTVFFGFIFPCVGGLLGLIFGLIIFSSHKKVRV